MDSNHRYLVVGQGSLPLDHGTKLAVSYQPSAISRKRFSMLSAASLVAEIGVEPINNHQALNLAALPVCVLGQSGACLRFVLESQEHAAQVSEYRIQDSH